MSAGHRLSDEAILASISSTLRQVVLPALDDGHARLATIQLVALAEYLSSRGPDPDARRRSEVQAALDSLSGNPLVDASNEADPYAAAAAVLVAAAGSHDEASDTARGILRPVLVRHLSADLAETAGLGEAFRGRLPDE